MIIDAHPSRNTLAAQCDPESVLARSDTPSRDSVPAGATYHLQIAQRAGVRR
jgi:hypothetical protein